jgi:colanic acid biosynthesis glycosyl transferase WcaI
VRILFLNQYFPPDPAPTGVLLHELGEHLREQGHTVEYLSARQDYRNAKKNRRRALRELSALGSILIQGLKAQRPDVVLSASSPPCLLVVATLIALRHKARNIHWAMDLYPELAVALNEIGNGFASKCFSALMGWAYRWSSLVVALDADMAAHLKNYGITAETVEPWVLHQPLPPLVETAVSSTGWTWLYSGNLGRAHEWETLLQTQSILEKCNLPICLVFQGGGPSWPLAQARATELGLRQCVWKPYVPESTLRESLLAANILTVTQRPETQGLLWPSKLALVSTLRRPILWVGPVDGAIAGKLRQRPGSGIFAPGRPEPIADWLEALYKSRGASGNPPSIDPMRARTQAMEKWTQLLDD